MTVLKKQDQLRQKIVKIEATMDSSIDKIKKTTMSKQEIEKMHNGILNSCEGLMGEIQQRQEQERREEEEVKSVNLFLVCLVLYLQAERLRKLKEEEERLRRLQEEMERERKRREEEERRRRQEEEERERRRKQEEEERERRRKQEEEERRM